MSRVQEARRRNQSFWQVASNSERSGKLHSRHVSIAGGILQKASGYKDMCYRLEYLKFRDLNNHILI